jgi:predicted nucleic acid-binding Zn ribbon protein
MRKCVECDSAIPAGQSYLCEVCFEEAMIIKLEMDNNRTKGA